MSTEKESTQNGDSEEMAVTRRDIQVPMTVSDVIGQIKLVQECMSKAMKDGEHYGVIPGTDKPTLFKAGAEKLNLMFRMAPDYTVTVSEMAGGHREYKVFCKLTHIQTGSFLGSGVGSCSTMESKYRYRVVSDFQDTGESIPKDAKENKIKYRKQGFGMKKVDGVWLWVKYTSAERQENPDIADTYNTVLKMAKKRAHVDAVLTVTAASDIFTQDLEELQDAETEVLANETRQANSKKTGSKPPAHNKSNGETKATTSRPKTQPAAKKAPVQEAAEDDFGTDEHDDANNTTEGFDSSKFPEFVGESPEGEEINEDLLTVITNGFDAYHVSLPQLAALVGHPIEEWRKSTVQALRAVYARLKKGELKASDFPTE